MDTLSEVIKRLQMDGYNYELPVSEYAKLNPSDWSVDEIYRFEGESNPSDSSILYAIAKTDGTKKLLIVNAYGVYADAAVAAFTTGLSK